MERLKHWAGQSPGTGGNPHIYLVDLRVPVQSHHELETAQFSTDERRELEAAILIRLPTRPPPRTPHPPQHVDTPLPAKLLNAVGSAVEGAATPRVMTNAAAHDLLPMTSSVKPVRPSYPVINDALEWAPCRRPFVSATNDDTSTTSPHRAPAPRRRCSSARVMRVTQRAPTSRCWSSTARLAQRSYQVGALRHVQRSGPSTTQTSRCVSARAVNGPSRRGTYVERDERIPLFLAR